MSMDFDEFGRAFVVELPEYNQYGSLKPHGKGAIKRLEDTDGDGRFDKATVYVDDLNYPTAVACWNGGILVGVAPDILFCKDTDGDGKADVRQKLFTGFGQDKAGEGMLNSFRWRIDNRFHTPTGLDGGEIITAQTSDAIQPKPINVGGRHLLLEPRGITIEATSGGGQHGMSLDDWNQRGFVWGNSEPVHLLMYDGRYLARNPYLQAPAAAINIAPDGKSTKLIRLSAVEPWRVLRTRLRKAGTIPSSGEGGTASGFFTGATGITVYRGDAWSAEFCGQVFVREVANNLVYRARLDSNGIGLTAHRADSNAKFLASTDNWFRPVQFANAPDGTLYVIDMYRELIEGAAFFAPQILKHMDPSAGSDKGRIYRIAQDGFQFKPAPRLGDLPTVELVLLFEHPNGWHRDTASRLIYQRQDRAAVAPLRALAATFPSPLARVMVLYSLQGLSALEPSLVMTALKAEEPKACEQALRLAESFADQADVREAMLPLVDDSDPRVRYQNAFTLGAFSGEPATRALSKLAVRDGADSWMQLAILSSIGQRRGEFLVALLQDREARKTPHVRVLLGAIASQIGAANVKHDFALFLQQLDSQSFDAADKSLAEELVKNLVSKQPSVRELLSGATGVKAKEIIAAMIRDARATASDEQKTPTDRATAVRTLATANFADVKEFFAALLQSRQPQPVQAATLETLARFDSLEVPQLIVAVWTSQTPQLRTTSVETLFTRPKWIAAFLNAVENQTVSRADLDPARIVLLKNTTTPTFGLVPKSCSPEQHWLRGKTLWTPIKIARLERRYRSRPRPLPQDVRGVSQVGRLRRIDRSRPERHPRPRQRRRVAQYSGPESRCEAAIPELCDCPRQCSHSDRYDRRRNRQQPDTPQTRQHHRNDTTSEHRRDQRDRPVVHARRTGEDTRHNGDGRRAGILEFDQVRFDAPSLDCATLPRQRITRCRVPLARGFARQCSCPSSARAPQSRREWHPTIHERRTMCSPQPPWPTRELNGIRRLCREEWEINMGLDVVNGRLKPFAVCSTSLRTCRSAMESQQVIRTASAPDSSSATCSYACQSVGTAKWQPKSHGLATVAT